MNYDCNEASVWWRRAVLKMYLNHAMALEANGMCELAGYGLDENNELSMRFTNQ